MMEAVVYHNWGRWVADCPYPDCPNAERYGKDPQTGVVGGLQELSFHCQETYGGCGTRCAALWPAERLEIESMLARRRVTATRNWRPGETLTDLAVEELSHVLD